MKHRLDAKTDSLRGPAVIEWGWVAVIAVCAFGLGCAVGFVVADSYTEKHLGQDLGGRTAHSDDDTDR